MLAGDDAASTRLGDGLRRLLYAGITDAHAGMELRSEMDAAEQPCLTAGGGEASSHAMAAISALLEQRPGFAELLACTFDVMRDLPADRLRALCLSVLRVRI